MDFTLTSYTNLLKTLKKNGYSFQPFFEYLTQKQSFNHHQPITHNSEHGTRNPERLIILRHDVDLRPQNSLETAQIENELGIKGSYYFRMVPKLRSKNQTNNQPISQPISSFMTREFAVRQSVNLSIFNPQIIQQIADLGHEIGYHYETMDTAETRLKEKGERIKERSSGNREVFKGQGYDYDLLVDAAYEEFCINLEEIKKIYPVKTICMHGSPRSKFDNRDIWKKYSYRELGIIGEPYFDIDFNDFFYLTDTGRRWDGHRVSVRDKMPQQELWNRAGLRFRSTKDIIKAANEDRLPDKIMITVHPQRWNNSFFPWVKELVLQNVKNIVKRIIIGIS